MPVLDALPSPIGRLGMVARWKPVHLGHAAVLQGMCDVAEHAVIGIGSSNVYTARSPFTPAETMGMIRAVLRGYANYSFVEVPDLGNGAMWQAMVRRLFGPLDVYLTANAWVRDLLAPHYAVVHPVHVVPPDRRIPLSGSMVRDAMAAGEDWRAMVPGVVASYIDQHGLEARFLRQFGPGGSQA